LQLLHKKMFDSTWKWAGGFRHQDTNIGVTWSIVPMQLKLLCDNVQYQVSNQTFGWDELAVRFHHRLVSVHPFPNGNGRHARLAADLLLRFNKQPALHWGKGNITDPGAVRAAYIDALKQADKGAYEPLIKFATDQK